MPDNTFFRIHSYITVGVMEFFSAKALLVLILTTAAKPNKTEQLLALLSLFRKHGKKDIQYQTLFLKHYPYHPLLTELFNSVKMTTFESDLYKAMHSKYSTAEHKRQILRLLCWHHHYFPVEICDLRSMLCATPAFIMVPIRLLRGTINTLQRMRIDWLLRDMNTLNASQYENRISQFNEAQMQQYIGHALPESLRWEQASIATRMAILNLKQKRQFACYVADVINTSDSYHEGAVKLLPHVANKLDKIQTQNVLRSLLKIFNHYHQQPLIQAKMMEAISQLSLHQIEDQTQIKKLFACLLIVIENNPDSRGKIELAIIPQISLNEGQTGEILALLLAMMDGKTFAQIENDFTWLHRVLAVLHLNEAQTDAILIYLLQIMDYINSGALGSILILQHRLFCWLAALQLNFDQMNRLFDRLFGYASLPARVASLHFYNVSQLQLFFDKQQLHPAQIERIVNYFIQKMASGIPNWGHIRVFADHCLKEETQAIKLLVALLEIKNSYRLNDRDSFLYHGIIAKFIPLMDPEQLETWASSVQLPGYLCYLISTCIKNLDTEKASRMIELFLNRIRNSAIADRGYFFAVFAKLVSILDKVSAKKFIKQLLREVPLDSTMFQNRVLLFIYSDNYYVPDHREDDLFFPSVFYALPNPFSDNLTFDNLYFDNRYLTIEILVQSILILEREEDPIQYEGLIELLFVVLKTELSYFIWVKPDTIVALVVKLERAQAERLIKEIILAPIVDSHNDSQRRYAEENQVEMISHLILYSEYGNIIQETLASVHNRDDYHILKDMSNLWRLIKAPQKEQTNDESTVLSCPHVFSRTYARVHP